MRLVSCIAVFTLHLQLILMFQISFIDWGWKSFCLPAVGGLFHMLAANIMLFLCRLHLTLVITAVVCCWMMYVFLSEILSSYISKFGLKYLLACIGFSPSNFTDLLSSNLLGGQLYTLHR